jgi:hypothetical protein
MLLLLLNAGTEEQVRTRSLRKQDSRGCSERPHKTSADIAVQEPVKRLPDRDVATIVQGIISRIHSKLAIPRLLTLDDKMRLARFVVYQIYPSTMEELLRYVPAAIAPQLL